MQYLPAQKRIDQKGAMKMLIRTALEVEFMGRVNGWKCWRETAIQRLSELLQVDRIDRQVHVLSDEGRGPTLEAVVSRMKTIRATRPAADSSIPNTPSLRLVLLVRVCFSICTYS